MITNESLSTKNITAKLIFQNWSWSFTDKILRMSAGLFVTSWMARHYGPAQFGIWNYAIALVSLVSIFSSLGLNEIIVRELIKFPDDENSLLGSVFYLKIIGGVLIFFICMILAYQYYPDDRTTFFLIIINSICFLIHPFETLDYYFQSKMRIKSIALARNSAFIIVAVIKCSLIAMNSSLIAIAWATFFELILSSCFLLSLYCKESSFLNWKFRLSTVTSLLKQSWPLMLSSLMSMIYMKIDQLMIKSMLDEKSLGEFSAAVRLSEVWYFIPITLSTAFFPSLISCKKKNDGSYQERTQHFFDILAFISISLAVVTSVISPLVVGLIYGDSYQSSAEILTVHIWAGVFVFLGVGSTQWLVIEHLEKFSFPRVVLGAILNIALNFFLIPKYNATGSAIATLISQLCAAYLANNTAPQLRPIFKIQTVAIINTFKLKPVRELLTHWRK